MVTGIILIVVGALVVRGLMAGARSGGGGGRARGRGRRNSWWADGSSSGGHNTGSSLRRRLVLRRRVVVLRGRRGRRRMRRRRRLTRGSRAFAGGTASPSRGSHLGAGPAPHHECPPGNPPGGRSHAPVRAARAGCAPWLNS